MRTIVHTSPEKLTLTQQRIAEIMSDPDTVQVVHAWPGRPEAEIDRHHRAEMLIFDEVGSPKWLPRTPTPANSKAALDVMRDAGIRRLQKSFDASERFMIEHGHRMPIEHGHPMPSEPDPRLNRRARRAKARKAVPA